jgi:2-oxoglutarate dehydrogenase E2 component (dihydrolipoamide succinyltransferase)
MGESVAEGTIVRWIKHVGDRVERDEPLFEVSTDKVDAEIPSPAAGILSEIKFKEGETIPVNTVVAIVGETAQTESSSRADGVTRAPDPAPPAAAPQPSRTRREPLPSGAAPARPWSASEADTLRLSPVVRKIAREHHIDVRQIAGSGSGGRVTKRDILAYLEAGAPSSTTAVPSRAVLPSMASDVNVERVPMSVMRKRIAEHMVLSRHTSAHVHSVFDVDFSRVSQIRDARKGEYEQANVKLTFLSFIVHAVAAALKAKPIVNASVEGDDIIYRKEINVGIAVALDWGLIVPVVRHADRKNLMDLSKAIADLAARARAKQLLPDEVQGGTFTITNPGSFGTLFGMPIINQPQVAILAVGAVEKRPVVVDDAVVVRPRAYLVLGYDHRLIDGAVADDFMSHVKKGLEEFSPDNA